MPRAILGIWALIYDASLVMQPQLHEIPEFWFLRFSKTNMTDLFLGKLKTAAKRLEETNPRKAGIHDRFTCFRNMVLTMMELRKIEHGIETKQLFSLLHVQCKADIS